MKSKPTRKHKQNNQGNQVQGKIITIRKYRTDGIPSIHVAQDSRTKIGQIALVYETNRSSQVYFQILDSKQAIRYSNRRVPWFQFASTGV